MKQRPPPNADSAPAAVLAPSPRLVDRLLSPLHRFLAIEAAGGCVLLACAAVGIVLANSPLAERFAAIWETPIAFGIGGYQHTHSVGHFVVNDVLMTVFFFVVGLEVKREVVHGELSDLRKAALPVVAAAGGMIVPALVYCLFPTGEAGARGWAIPMATDIAFVVGVLALLGPRAPLGLKVFLLTLAIADDIGAILVIAAVFTESVAWGWLGVAGAGITATLLLAKLGVRGVLPYVVVGVVVWLGFFESGVHPTIAGVILGLLTPARPWIDRKSLTAALDGARDATPGDTGEHDDALNSVRFAAREATSPLHRLETTLHPWVAFVVMPLFALANAGVAVEPAALLSPVAIAVAVGLVVGKGVGVSLFAWLAVASGFASLPSGVGWRHLVGGALLAGIGFTMALFLNELAFEGEAYATQAGAGKIGVLVGSVASAIGGATLLVRTPPLDQGPAEA
ncbi:MAG: Na+/H+ antiporter NhaA [Lacipirellulaceae bacterium]